PQAARFERPQQQPKPDEGGPEPGGELGEQDRRRLGGEHPVTPPVFGDGTGHQPEGPVNGPVYPPGQPAPDRAGHDQRADDTGPRREHQHDAERCSYPTAQERHHHEFSPTVNGYANHLAAPTLSPPGPGIPLMINPEPADGEPAHGLSSAGSPGVGRATV